MKLKQWITRISKAFYTRLVVCSFVKKYVNWERMWYEPTNNFKVGEKIKLNWKAISMGYSHNSTMTFKSIDRDNVVDTFEGDSWNLYWLCRS